MPRDLRIVAPNRPGSGVAIFKALAGAGINIDGLCADLRPGERWVYIHILVEESGPARAAIERAGFEVLSDREVMTVELEDRPGAVEEVVQEQTAQVKNKEVNYMATRTRLVLGTEDMHEDRVGVRMEDAKFP
jgi:hypothetical protein